MGRQWIFGANFGFGWDWKTKQSTATAAWKVHMPTEAGGEINADGVLGDDWITKVVGKVAMRLVPVVVDLFRFTKEAMSKGLKAKGKWKAFKVWLEDAKENFKKCMLPLLMQWGLQVGTYQFLTSELMRVPWEYLKTNTKSLMKALAGSTAKTYFVMDLSFSRTSGRNVMGLHEPPEFNANGQLTLMNILEIVVKLPGTGLAIKPETGTGVAVSLFDTALFNTPINIGWGTLNRDVESHAALTAEEATLKSGKKSCVDTNSCEPAPPDARTPRCAMCSRQLDELFSHLTVEHDIKMAKMKVELCEKEDREEESRSRKAIDAAKKKVEEAEAKRDAEEPHWVASAFSGLGSAISDAWNSWGYSDAQKKLDEERKVKEAKKQEDERKARMKIANEAVDQAQKEFDRVSTAKIRTEALLEN